MTLDLNDKTANGNNLTNHGATDNTSTTPTVTGDTHVANLVAASSQYLEAANSSSINTTGDCTFQAWIYLASSPAGTYFIFSKGDSGLNNGQYRIGVVSAGGAGTALTAQFGAGNGATINYHNVQLTASYSFNTWYHVTWVWTAASHKLEAFLNGVSKGTDTSGTVTTLGSTTTPVEVGQSVFSSSNGNFFDGNLDELRIWNVARTSGAISGDYNSRLIGNESNLVAYWPFESLVTASGGFFLAAQ